MKTLSKGEYLNKMRGCWLGKAIGGTMGAVFEARRGAFDIDYYPMKLENGMLPNDDLDLQLVWLNAAERYLTSLNAEKLTDYWLMGVLPNWAEYGVGKSNMRMGLNAPASGRFNNRYKDSNGAWIRSEIWACIAPGHPEVAVRYAMEDACTDHAGEGVYAEIFTAALESAAFVESDPYRLIEIALSYIPEDCDCAGAVRKMVELYRSGIDWKAARIALLNAYPDSFGGQLGDVDPDVPNGQWGYDAPSNIALMLIGWLYAGSDFGRAICITAGCGEDDDCTTGALGALLGILLGADGIPDKWKTPIGEEIKTICVNTFPNDIKVPKNMTELVTRTLKLVPSFLASHVDLLDDNAFVTANEGDGLRCPVQRVMDDGSGWDDRYFRDHIVEGFVFRGQSPLANVCIKASDGIDMVAGGTVKLDLYIENAFCYSGVPYYADIRWLLPEGMSIEGGNMYTAFVNQQHCGSGRNLHSVTVNIETVRHPTETLVCEVSIKGFASKIYVPVTLVSQK